MSTIAANVVLSSSGSGVEQTFTTLDSDSNCTGVLSVLVDGTLATTDATFRVYQWAPDASYRALAFEATITTARPGVLSSPLLVGGAVTGLTFSLTTTDAVDWPVTVLKEANVLTVYRNDMSPTSFAANSNQEISSDMTGGVLQALAFAQLPLDSGETLRVRDRIADAASTNVVAQENAVDDTATAGAYPGVVIYGVPITAATNWQSVLYRDGGSSARDIYLQQFKIG